MTEDESGETRSNGSPNGLERAQPNRSAEPLMAARENNGTGCACVGVWSGFFDSAGRTRLRFNRAHCEAAAGSSSDKKTRGRAAPRRPHQASVGITTPQRRS